MSSTPCQRPQRHCHRNQVNVAHERARHCKTQRSEHVDVQRCRQRIENTTGYMMMSIPTELREHLHVPVAGGVSPTGYLTAGTNL